MKVTLKRLSLKSEKIWEKFLEKLDTEGLEMHNSERM